MNGNKNILEDPFGKLLYHAERLLVNRLQRNFRAAGFDVTAEQWRILINLWSADGQTQQELSAKTGKDKGNITRIISGLERRNIVVRVPNHADGRSKLIYLTAKGRACQESLVAIAQKTLRQAQKGIANQDLHVCRVVLGGVIANLG